MIFTFKSDYQYIDNILNRGENFWYKKTVMTSKGAEIQFFEIVIS